MKSSAYKAKQKLGLTGKGRPCRNYHACLQCILQSFKEYQGKQEAIWAWIRIGNHVANKKMFLLTFIIGDSQSQDKMCGIPCIWQYL